ncbi:ABC transporter permease, partial [uncultured Streptococcus sp.]|uniref:ABC transporter permease n=1 Tax=uncultured Streptococcus sp. TaxID=83427 RepID=UPI0028D064DD
MLIYVLRSIKSSGARSLLITMSIMISAMVLLLNFTINQDVLQQYKNIHKETYQDFDILIKGKEPYFSSITYPTEMVSERIDIVYYTVENKKVENSYFKLLGTDIDSLVAESLITSDTKLDKNSVVMSSETANYYGNVGDSIKLSDGKNQFELKLTSIVANEGLIKISSNFPLIILDIERLRELTNLNSNQNSAVLLNVNNDNDITKVEKNIKNNNENLVVQNLVSNAEIRNNVTMIRTIL